MRNKIAPPKPHQGRKKTNIRPRGGGPLDKGLAALLDKAASQTARLKRRGEIPSEIAKGGPGTC